MADSPDFSLRPQPTGASLARSPGRSSLIARGREAASTAATNPHFQQAMQHFQSRRFPEAAASFTLAAEAGHAESQYMLSTLYDEGQGVPQDSAIAALWERKAADQGHAYAQANLSFRAYTAEDFEQAFTWCQRAAHSNLAWAQYNLGLMYRKGEGVDPSDTEAARWYTLAAQQDFPEAQQKLADLFYFGQGVPRSLTQAASWYERAAHNGNAEAQFLLGQLYSMGVGVEHDYTLSRHWTRQAALQGHEQAIQELKRRKYRDP